MVHVQRILTLGPCGAGKSFFSRRLGEALDLPVIHLDAEYWLPDWTEPARESWESRVAELLARPTWIIDGSHLGTLRQRLSRADTVILLDLPTWVCFYRVLRRLVTTYGRVRPDMGRGCPERLDTGFLQYVLQYRRDRLPEILLELERFGGAMITLRSRHEVDRFLVSRSMLLQRR